MREIIVGIVGEMKALEQRLHKLKVDFEDYIKDKSIPLSERWQIWQDAPESLKNTGDWCSAGRLDAFRLLFTGRDDAIGYDGSLIHAERYQTVTLADEYALECIVDYLLDRFDVVVADASPIDWGDLDSVGTLHPKVDEFLVAYREELLAKNLYSFTYDW